MLTLKDIQQKLAALKALNLANPNTLMEMEQKERLEHQGALKGFLHNLNLLATQAGQLEDPEKTKTLKEIEAVTLEVNMLRENFKRVKYKKSVYGKVRKAVGLKSPAKQKAKNKMAQTELEADIAAKKELFDSQLKGIQDKRREKREHEHSGESPRSILTSAMDEFRNALTPPLLATDVIELQRKQEEFDQVQAAKDVYKIQGETTKTILHTAKRILSGIGVTVGEFTEQTTGGVFKAAALFLAWPLLLPIKVANQACTAAKYGCCAADGVLGFFDKGLDRMFEIFPGKMERNPKTGEIDFKDGRFWPNVAKGIPHFFPRGPIRLARGLFQLAALGCRFLEKHIDADKWLKSKPVTAGFAVGGVGTIVLIAVVIASIPGLGIPIAALGVAAAVATVGAVAQGYFKARAKARELKTLQLNSDETAQLEKYEYEHRATVKSKPEASAKAETSLPSPTVLKAHAVHQAVHAVHQQKSTALLEHSTNTAEQHTKPVHPHYDTHSATQSALSQKTGTAARHPVVPKDTSTKSTPRPDDQ